MVNLPSVTTILEATRPLEQQYRLQSAIASNPARALQNRDAARERGNYIHKYVSLRLQGAKIGHGLYSKWLRRLDPWIMAINAHNGGMIWCDRLVWDLDNRYAGTFDLISSLPGYEGNTLVDLKTCAFKAWPEAIHEAQLQAAAYAAAWNRQQCALKVDRVASVHVSPYALQVEISEGDDFRVLVDEFLQRRKLFGSRATAALDTEDPAMSFEAL
jgi:hypothetical protein